MGKQSPRRPKAPALNVAITGANSELGLSLVNWAAGKSGRIVGLSRNGSAKLGKLQKAGKVNLIPLDLGHAGQITEAATYIRKTLGHLDLLINNASGWHDGDLASTSESDILAQINSSISGTIMLTKALLPVLKRSDHALIINVCSTVGSGYRFSPNTLYAALKGALEAFGRSLRNDLRPSGIRVTNLHLGKLATETPLAKRVPLRDVIRMVDALAGCSRITSVDAVVITPIEYEY